MKHEFTDRYKALGIPYPDRKTMCKGQCEGTGVVPVTHKVQDARLKALWLEAEIRKPSDDCYHFVVCPDCAGTGKKFRVINTGNGEAEIPSNSKVVDV